MIARALLLALVSLVLAGCSGPGPFSLGSDALVDGSACGPGLGACGDGEYCDLPSDQCGGEGFCRPRPSGCDSACVTVCGCDAVEYCNACVAQAAGVDVGPSSACPSEYPRCGGFLGERCSGAEFCDFEDTSCGSNGALGRCLPRPAESVCPAECTGACGCDGVDYCNECFANAAGIDRSLACP